MFLKKYDETFPLRKITMITKNLGSPWITTKIKKSSRKNKCLYEKFLKSKTTKSIKTYKQYKNLFEKIKKGSKKLYYQDKLHKC